MRILNEEDRNVVADQVPIAFLGIELHGKAAHVARHVGRALVAGHRREAHEDRRLHAHFVENRRARNPLQRIGQFEIAMRSKAARMHNAFGNALMVEVLDLFEK